MAADFTLVRALARRSVDDGVIPGLVLGIAQGGQVRFLDAFGHRQVVPEVEGLTTDVVYDLASLTKAVVTSLLVMRGVGSGIWGLDDPLDKHLPSLAALIWEPWKGSHALPRWCAAGEAGGLPTRLAARPEVTLRRTLAHAAGFAAHRPFFEQVIKDGVAPAQGRERIVTLAAAEPLAYQPGTRSLYSDLGFILLGDLVERGLGGRLDVLAEKFLFAPLGLRATGFSGSAALSGRKLAPTEHCPVRGRMLVGEVHDLNAFAMGGVAGHAGLFANAADLLELANALCAAWRDTAPTGGAPLVSAEVLRLFWQPAGIPGSTWRLGWDGPAATGSLAGDRLSRQAVGHLGFTGCSLWIDPERETSVVLLTNFVHPTARKDPRFRALRPALHDAALDAMGYCA
jgi:CubicO group peptidase (beta-lactamase class C family)